MTRLWLARLTAVLLGVGGALLLIGGAVARPAADHYPAYTLPGDAVYPEGVAYQASTGDYFTGSTTNGAILRGNVERPEAEVWLVGGTEGMTTTRGMKVDGKGRLFVAAGPQGMMYVFDVAGKRLLAKFATGVSPTLVNDVTIAPNGDAYFTDSSTPMLYRVSDAGGQWALEKIDLAGSPIVYTQGFNLGGIAAGADGRYLVLAQGNVGKLFRYDTATRQAVPIDLGREDVLGADGIWLEGTTLHVMRNAQGLLVTLELTDEYTRGTVTQVIGNPAFAFPTTIARAGDHILVVNSQFNRRNAGQPPNLPFQLLSLEVPAPAGQPPGMPTTGAGDSLVGLLALAGLLLLLSGGVLRYARR